MIYLELFYTFFLIGLFTFGGGYAMIPMIQEQVLSKGWISQNELTNFISLSEMTPGPFAVNISTFIGNNTAGILGAISATFGVILPSFIIIIIVSLILNKFLKNRFVKAGLKGVRPIILSLILATAITFFFKAVMPNGNDIYSFDRRVLALLIILFGLAILYKKVNKKALNPIYLLLFSGFLGLLIF